MELTFWGKLIYWACDVSFTDKPLPLHGDEALGKHNKRIRCCGDVHQVDMSKLDTVGYREKYGTSASICVKCNKRVRITN